MGILFFRGKQLASLRHVFTSRKASPPSLSSLCVTYPFSLHHAVVTFVIQQQVDGCLVVLRACIQVNRHLEP